MAVKKKKKSQNAVHRDMRYPNERHPKRRVQQTVQKKAPVKSKKLPNQTGYYDYSMVAVIIFLICFGLVMLYSISSYQAQIKFDGDSMYFLKRQGIFSFVSIFGMIWVSKWDYHRWAKIATAVFWIAMFLMSLVRFTPLGVEINHARRWLRLPMKQTIQPSEIMKIAVIIFVPFLICKMGDYVHTLKGSMIVLGVGFAAMFAVYYLTDNLSTGIIVFGIVYAMLTVIHKRSDLFVAAAAAVVILGVVGSFALSKLLENSTSFRLRRILAWLQPEKYAATTAYQTIQGLYAIGSGGFFGKGLGNGAQKMLIPEVQNDMILSAICEELGVFGAIIILILFGLLLYRLLFIAQNAPDMYGALIVTGIMAHISLQVILNIMVVTNMIPNTGITLPFISYGGTSIVFLMGEMGIALGVSKKIKLEE